jgi:serine/threonine-protein kinase
MTPGDWVELDFRQGIRAESGIWYNNLQRLGVGGNAVTYLMLAGSGDFAGVCFAVKVFRRVSQPESRDKFLSEVKFLRACRHPCILGIYDDGVYREDHPFVVVEYLPRTLADIIRSDTATLVERLSYVLQLLSVLAYLEQLQPPVVHRDIKPQNIFVKGRSCVLGDFGLVKHLERPEDVAARQGALKESVGPGMPFFYRTPDQVAYARGVAGLTTKSDVFQLGLVTAELFCGENPELRAENNEHLADVRLRPREEWVSLIPPGFRQVLANLIGSMLEFEPARRPAAVDLLAPWRGLFFEVADRQQALEGRVFR